MGIETLLLLSLPILFGTMLMCIAAGDRPAYAASDRSSSHLLKLVLLVLPIFAYGFYLVAMRPLDAGNDTARYIRTYNQLNGIVSSVGVGARFFGNTEFLWWPLQSLLKLLLSSRGWLIANYLLVFASTAMYYKRAARPLKLAPEIFALVFLTFFLVYSGNIMRQALAAPIGAIGFYLALERRFLRAAVLIAISVGLHWSSIVFVAAPLLLLRVFDRDGIYFALPPMALAFSALSSTVIGDLVSALNIPGISEKFDLYFSLDHQSHVGVVWKTANFWICSTSSIAFLTIARASKQEDKRLHKYTLLFISLVFFGINTADFSERYMPLLLLALPLQITLIVDRFSIPNAVKNMIVFGSFVLLASLVLFAESSQYTLGYTV